MNSRIPVSQQKKTGISIIADPTSYKKPSLSDLRNEISIGESSKGYVPPKLSDLRNDEKEAKSFVPPKLSDIRSEEKESKTFLPPKLSDLHKDEKNQAKNEGNTVNKMIENKSKKEEINYIPYTVDDFKQIQQLDDASTNRGGLGPSYDQEWEKKKEARAKIMQFAKKTVQDNKSVIPKKRSKAEPDLKQPTKLDKMKEYANNIPRPKIIKQDAEIKGTIRSTPVKASYDIDTELQRHAHFQARVQYLRERLECYLK